MQHTITVTRTFRLPDFLIEEIQSRGPFHSILTAIRAIRPLMIDAMPVFSDLSACRQVAITLADDGVIEIGAQKIERARATSRLFELSTSELTDLRRRSPFVSEVQVLSALNTVIPDSKDMHLPTWALRSAAQQLIDEGHIEVAGMAPRVAPDAQDYSKVINLEDFLDTAG